MSRARAADKKAPEIPRRAFSARKPAAAIARWRFAEISYRRIFGLVIANLSTTRVQEI